MHLFWEDAEALQKDSSDVRALAPSDLLGLWSCLRVGFAVHLWSYSDISVFRHSGLHRRDAGQLLPRDEAVALLRRGLRIQHLADLARLLAVEDHGKRVRTSVGSASCARPHQRVARQLPFVAVRVLGFGGGWCGWSSGRGAFRDPKKRYQDPLILYGKTQGFV